MSLLEVRAVTKRFGGFTALDNVDLDVHPGERLGLIGPNGSGKSTLVNCIGGALRCDGGSIAFDGRSVGALTAHARTRLGVARSFQVPRPFASMTVAENLSIPLLFAARRREPMRAAEAHTEALRVLAQVGMEAKAGTFARELTQVDMRKLELARALAARPKLLISDEALAGLSSSEIDELLALLLSLKEQGVAVIMIEHVMRAVMSFSDRVAVLVAGRKIADGAPQDVAANPEVVKAYLGE